MISLYCFNHADTIVLMLSDAYQQEIGIEREKKLEAERELSKLRGNGHKLYISIYWFRHRSLF